MDKAEFIERLTRQFNGSISGAERIAKLEIEGSRDRLDRQGFREWLMSEHLATNAELALKPFRLILRNTPEAAAHGLAELLAFTFDGEVDWNVWWSNAFLSTGNPWKKRDWPLHSIFAAYSRAFIAEARIRVFLGEIESE